MVANVASCGGGGSSEGAKGTAGAGGSSSNAGGSSSNAGGDTGTGGQPVGNPHDGPGIDSCVGVMNVAGPMVDMAWPSTSNVGHDAVEGDTAHFHWGDGTPHNVLQVAQFEGQSPPLDPFGDARWPLQLSSGAKTATGVYDWNTGGYPCGYRPGLYYFVDEGNPAGGIVQVTYTTKDNPSALFKPKACSLLASPNNYQGRYADYAGRANCTEFEVNNFQTQAHFDWVPPTFGVTQGDLVLFRWSGLHNVVQVHDAASDKLISGGLLSGPRTVCVPGPKYSCINGPLSFGEYMIDTASHRPGMIHLSDGCAYGCADCPWECHGAAHVPTGTNMEFLLSRAERPAKPVAGSCCAIDKSKGSACRVVDLYNDNEGMQFDYNVAVNRGDLVRLRWGGSVKIVQTTPMGPGNSAPSKNPRAGGIAMPSAVECIPGPNWSCLGANTAPAELVVDVDKAITSGQYESASDGSYLFDFFAFGENTDGLSSADSGILFYVDQKTAYTSNPPCP